MKRVPFLELKKVLELYHKTEQKLISTNPQLCVSSLENHPDSYTWIRLPMPGEQPETVPNMIDSGVEDFPNTCLAGILVAILKNQVPTGVHLAGISLYSHKNTVRFCISGSTSLEELRILCEQYLQNSGHEG
jgi:hypothetical protein